MGRHQGHRAQLRLAARGRGGYRAGAGRPRGRRPGYVPHITRPKLTGRDVVHVTQTVVPGLPNLRAPAPAAVIEAVFSAECCRKGFRLIHYSIRGNHLHLICEANNRIALARGLQRVFSRIARGLNRLFGRRGRVFADRYHARIVRTPREARDVLSYVLLNEHKDRAKRGITVVGIDPYSSGDWFDGWADINTSPRPASRSRPPPVTPARSWLLHRGWRRHGLIRTTERAPQRCPER